MICGYHYFWKHPYGSYGVTMLSSRCWQLKGLHALASPIFSDVFGQRFLASGMDGLVSCLSGTINFCLFEVIFYEFYQGKSPWKNTIWRILIFWTTWSKSEKIQHIDKYFSEAKVNNDPQKNVKDVEVYTSKGWHYTQGVTLANENSLAAHPPSFARNLMEVRLGATGSPSGPLRQTWNSKQPFINGCFSWMIPNLYMENGCFTKHPLKNWLFGVPGIGFH